ncbi:GRAM domain protein [mine drainage metagenome]|uniref:GRAM domain protein n=1 Tax=mine drainage metagenome TaxID=410659 RepID=A0A1J5T0T0_9ZZZZ
MNKKNRFRAGLSFGIGMTVFFILQNLLTNENQTSNQVFKSIVAGLVAGAISGVVFGWLIGLFSKSKFVKQTSKIDTEQDENILFETPANHFKGIEGVAGKLYLTNKRLIFKSHKLNIQNHQLAIQLTDINDVGRYKTLGVVNNGLSITTVNGKTEKFVVEQVEDWIKFLTEQNSLQQSI